LPVTWSGRVRGRHGNGGGVDAGAVAHQVPPQDANDAHQCDDKNRID
jgi:hypothetical protein